MLSRTYINLQKNETIWHSADVERVLDMLESSHDGLSSGEAMARIKKLGENTIRIERQDTLLKILFRQLINPVSIILIIGAGISLVVSHLFDAMIIFATVLVNISIGFFQEFRVSKIFEKLKDTIRYSAKVKRDGIIKTIASNLVTKGDIIVLRPGDRIVADARLIATENFSVNEATLTGESIAVAKHSAKISKNLAISEQKNIVFAGTFVETGIATAIVVRIGLETEIGKISKYIQSSLAEESTPLQKQLSVITRNLSFIFVALSSLLFLIGLIREVELYTLFLTAVAVAVAAIPEGLPIALTAGLAHGSAIILKHGGIIRKLSSAEALGATSIVAMDKTGTLTVGDMRLAKIILPEGTVCSIFECSLVEDNQHVNKKILNQILQYCTILSNAVLENRGVSVQQLKIAGNPTDRALAIAGYESGIFKEDLLKDFHILSELPFQAQYKYQATIIEHKKSLSLVALGAGEIILEKCSSKGGKEATGNWHATLSLAIESFANQGFRVMALATKKINKDIKLTHNEVKDLTLEGLLILSDPIRPEVDNAIKVAKSAGIKPIVISGDHLLTTRYIAKELGIINSDNKAVDGRYLGAITPSTISSYNVFARVTPEQKIQIIKALQHNGNIVSMIGDGVNDAPALVKSDIGIAVDSGTDIAKEAADMILQKSSFAVVIEAVKQGRVIIENIRKVMLFVLAGSCAELVIIGGSIISGIPAGLLPGQILYVNIIVDILPAIAMAYDKGRAHILADKPSIFSKLLPSNLVKLLVVFAIISNTFLFILYYATLYITHDLELARTFTFIALGLTILLSAFSISNITKTINTSDLFKNPILTFSVLIGIILYATALYVPQLASLLEVVPLNLNSLLLLVGFSILNIIILEVAKKRLVR